MKCSMAASDDDNYFYFRDRSTVFRTIDICAQARGQNFSSLKAKVVAHWNLISVSTKTQRVTLKSPKMSNDDDKQSNYRLMNVLYRTKAIDLLANLQGNKR